MHNQHQHALIIHQNQVFYETYPDSCLHHKVGHILEGLRGKPDGCIVALLLEPFQHPINFLQMDAQFD